ncbi:MAG: hypothetical protein ACKOBW_17535, partial [Planctomycetota bacterium]
MSYPTPTANKSRRPSQILRYEDLRLLGMLLGTLLCLGSGGCGPQQSSVEQPNVEQPSVEQPSAQQHPAQQNPSPQSAAPSATDPTTAKSNTESTSADPKPDSQAETNQRRLQLLTQAEQQLKTGDWDELAETLESLAELPTQGQSEEQAAAIERLTTT